MFEILIAGIVVLVVGLPIVCTFDKWKKEMEQEEQDNNGK